jgi:hypothetical protein
MMPFACRLLYLDISVTCSYFFYSEKMPEEDSHDRAQWRKEVENLLNALKCEQERRVAEDIASKINSNPTLSLNDIETMIATHKTEMSFPPATNAQCLPDGAVDFGTAESFNFKTVIALRTWHETEESRSAITQRYQRTNPFTTSDGPIAAQPQHTKSPIAEGTRVKGETIEGDSTLELKGQIVKEITRVMSSALTASHDKNNAAGLARLARWRAQGVYPESVYSSGQRFHVDDPSRSSIGATGHIVHGRTVYYSPLEAADARHRFTTADISETHPLKHGSFVVFVFCGKMCLGRGMVGAQISFCNIN